MFESSIAYKSQKNKTEMKERVLRCNRKCNFSHLEYRTLITSADFRFHFECSNFVFCAFASDDIKFKLYVSKQYLSGVLINIWYNFHHSTKFCILMSSTTCSTAIKIPLSMFLLLNYCSRFFCYDYYYENHGIVLLLNIQSYLFFNAEN